MTIVITEAALQNVKNAEVGDALKSMSAAISLLGFVPDLYIDGGKLYQLAIEYVSSVLVKMIQNGEIALNELDGAGLSALLKHLEENIPFDLEDEIYNQIQEWRTYRKPHRNTGDG
ncbi:MAG: cytochrome P450 [Anaerolineaceae bacterium]|nr:cytochrome P450 [Anaerolineaceae bacterium]